MGAVQYFNFDSSSGNLILQAIITTTQNFAFHPQALSSLLGIFIGKEHVSVSLTAAEFLWTRNFRSLILIQAT